MSRESRSRRNYWVLVIIVFAVIAYGAYAAVNSTGTCQPGYVHKWEWLPPRWTCQIQFDT